MIVVGVRQLASRRNVTNSARTRGPGGRGGEDISSGGTHAHGNLSRWQIEHRRSRIGRDGAY